ncbi:hypothetical protein [Streptomyces sp. NPDC056544]|uniref:hypothetical protein n=1 Tax=unclassified Streptomyces TaxID=2593676 RepID=UPI0036A0EDD8
MAFDDAGAPGQGKASHDGVAVTVDACGEGVEAGEVVLPDGVEPLRQPFALALSEYLTEGADVVGEGVRFRAVDENGFEPKVLRLGEGLGSAEDPPCDDAG